MTSFHDLGLAEPITRALAEEKYLTPTPIQLQTIPVALLRRDLIGKSQGSHAARSRKWPKQARETRQVRQTAGPEGIAAVAFLNRGDDADRRVHQRAGGTGNPVWRATLMHAGKTQLAAR